MDPDPNNCLWKVVPHHLFDELVQRLRVRESAKKWGEMVVFKLIQRITSGVLDGQVLTNDWPEFTVVLSHLPSIGPLKNGILHVFGSSHNDIDKILPMIDQLFQAHKGKGWIMGESWLMKGLQSELQLKCGGVTGLKSVQISYDGNGFYFPNPQVLTNSGLLECPEGFVLKKLEEHHAEEVAATWKYSSTDKLAYFKNVIRSYHNIGVFPKLESGEISDSPAGWCLQYPHGRIANLFVYEKYRRRGLGKLLVLHMCTLIAKDGEVPAASVSKDNTNSIAFFLSLGFIHLGDNSKIEYQYC